jgi:transketolase
MVEGTAPTGAASVDGAQIAHLERLARAARRLIVRAIYQAQAGHLGGPLSAVDLLTALYFGVLNVDPARPRWEDRDRFVLSKGHSSIALYAVMALRGFFPEEELLTFDQIDSRLQGHPDMTSLEGLDMSTGSLGQGISAAVGMALGAKLLHKGFHTWVMIGDGEAQEGQVWEAAFIATQYRLGNLTAIMDWNGLQQFGWGAGSSKERQPPAEHVPGVFRAFGWEVLTIDGHDMGEILAAYRQALAPRCAPLLIAARTVKGKGVSFMEHDFNWHARPPSAHDLERALQELRDID